MSDAAIREQVIPKGINVDIPTLVIQDMESRAQVGEQRYGERLRPFNGRDPLVDAYQEALDLVVYLRQVIYERDNPKQV